VTGVVTDDRNRPVSDATVIAFATDPARWYAQSRFVACADASAGGTFTLQGLAPSEYYVVGVNNRDPSDIRDELDDGNFLHTLAAQAVRIIVTEGQRTTLGVRVFPGGAP
jgi:hypothetical protein